jgi:hypothetical protein
MNTRIYCEGLFMVVQLKEKLITNGNEVWEPGFGGDQAGSPGIH